MVKHSYYPNSVFNDIYSICGVHIQMYITPAPMEFVWISEVLSYNDIHNYIT